MEPEDTPPMSGSNSMCVATALLETGLVPMQEPETRFKLDMPGGVIEVWAECRDGKCVSITFRNAPAFAERLDAPLELEGHGTINLDIAYGGMFFGIVDAKALGFSVTPDEARDLGILGEKIRVAAREQKLTKARLEQIAKVVPRVTADASSERQAPLSHEIDAPVDRTFVVAGGLDFDGSLKKGEQGRLAVPGRS